MPQISYLTTIEFEVGTIRLLPDVLIDAGIKRPMVITDRGLMQVGLLNRLLPFLTPFGQITVFSETPTNPTEDAVSTALATYRNAGCDGLVAFGGGSSIDLAKGVALLTTHDEPLEQYAAILGGSPKIAASIAPIIAIPTTAGTGSEVGRGALITLRDGRKLGFISPFLIPKRAICDPELTLGLPAILTAATGMDALTHCIETFLSPRINPPAEAIALDGAARAWRWIERATSHPEDIEARWQMLMASLQGGLTFQKGLGAVHSMSHALGGLKNPVLHHGTLNAVILPTVLRFNANHVGAKYTLLRNALGLSQKAELAAEVSRLTTRLKLPKTLREIGISEDILNQMVPRALADHSTATNPRSVEAADFKKLFTEAFG